MLSLVRLEHTGMGGWQRIRLCCSCVLEVGHFDAFFPMWQLSLCSLWEGENLKGSLQSPFKGTGGSDTGRTWCCETNASEAGRWVFSGVGSCIFYISIRHIHSLAFTFSHFQYFLWHIKSHRLIYRYTSLSDTGVSAYVYIIYVATDIYHK